MHLKLIMALALVSASGCAGMNQPQSRPELAEIQALLEQAKERDSALQREIASLRTALQNTQDMRTKTSRTETDKLKAQHANELIKLQTELEQSRRETASLKKRVEDLSDQVIQYKAQAVWGERLTEHVASEIVKKTVQKLKAIPASQPITKTNEK